MSDPQQRALHMRLNVEIRRLGGTAPACDGPDCTICRLLSTGAVPSKTQHDPARTLLRTWLAEDAEVVPSVSPAPQEQECSCPTWEGAHAIDCPVTLAITHGRPAVSTPDLSQLIAEFMAKWTNEANGYVRGSMMESPVGDMNRASASVVRTMLRELKALLSQTRA